MIKVINSLPISEETLGAYLEGNLPEHESIEVEKLLENDSEFREFVDEVQIDDINYDESIYDYFPDFDNEFSLPEIPEVIDESDDLEIEVVDEIDDFETIRENTIENINDDRNEDSPDITLNETELYSDIDSNDDCYDYNDLN